MSYPRYRGDGAVIVRQDQSIPDTDGPARSSWMAHWYNRLKESFDAIVPIPMTRELRHKRLHIAAVVKASRGRPGTRSDGSASKAAAADMALELASAGLWRKAVKDEASFRRSCGEFGSGLATSTPCRQAALSQRFVGGHRRRGRQPRSRSTASRWKAMLCGHPCSKRSERSEPVRQRNPRLSLTEPRF